MATCKDCIHYDICIFHLKGDENKKCIRFKNKADLVKVVRCEDCNASSKHKIKEEDAIKAWNTRTPKERGGEK